MALRYSKLTSAGISQYKGKCPLCEQKATFGPKFKVMLGIRLIVMAASSPKRLLTGAAGAEGVGRSVYCSSCDSHIEVCPKCNSAFKAMLSLKNTVCPNQSCSASLY